MRTALAATWSDFGELRGRLGVYLKSSELEFGELIAALDDCWTMTETLRSATGRLKEITSDGGHTKEIRRSMTEGCAVFRKFLGQIERVGSQLASCARETQSMLGTTNLLQAHLGPLKYIAFHFRLEGSRLSPENLAAVSKVYDEMREVLSNMKRSGESQQNTLNSILEKLAAATQSVETISSAYARRSVTSESRIQASLDQLSQVPAELLSVQEKADKLASVADKCIGGAVKVLQGHDAIRQRVVHMLDAIEAVRGMGDPGEPAIALGRQDLFLKSGGDEPQQNEAGHTLALEREQGRRVLALIASTGSRIEQELNGVIAFAEDIAASEQAADNSQADAHTRSFERAVDHLAALRAEMVELLAGEVQMANFVLSQIEPVRDLLNAKSDELEVLAKSMKRLAFNVLIGAAQMPSAKGIDVLGGWTSETSGQVLKLARSLNSQFANLGATLQQQGAEIAGEVRTVEDCLQALDGRMDEEAMRNSRRCAFDEVARLGKEAQQLRNKTVALLQSLEFVDKGAVLFNELDAILGRLLALYPKPERPFDSQVASSGYTMQEQFDVHANRDEGGLGDPGLQSTSYARLGAVAAGEDYGDNVELF